jgi:hypothetical protein
VAENAKLAAWITSKKKEEATATTGDATLATMSTMSPTTMTELVTKQSTNVSEKVATQTTLKMIKKNVKKLFGRPTSQVGPSPQAMAMATH